MMREVALEDLEGSVSASSSPSISPISLKTLPQSHGDLLIVVIDCSRATLHLAVLLGRKPSTSTRVPPTSKGRRIHFKEPRWAFSLCVFVAHSNKIFYKMFFFQQKLYYFQYIHSGGGKHALRKTAYLPTKLVYGKLNMLD